MTKYWNISLQKQCPGYSTDITVITIFIGYTLCHRNGKCRFFIILKSTNKIAVTPIVSTEEHISKPEQIKLKLSVWFSDSANILDSANLQATFKGSIIVHGKYRMTEIKERLSFWLKLLSISSGDNVLVENYHLDWFPISIAFTMQFCLLLDTEFPGKMKAWFMAQRKCLCCCTTKIGRGHSSPLLSSW